MIRDDCVSRRDVIDTIMGEPSETYYPCYFAEMIRELPAAAHPKVIRCKDCKYCESAPKWKDFEFGCMLRREYTTETDFCSQAERKETNE